MNWTGGNLARHIRLKQDRATRLRQNEYFAKARLGLLNGSKKTSPDLAILGRPSSHPLAAHDKLQVRLSSNDHGRPPQLGSHAGRKRRRTPPRPSRSRSREPAAGTSGGALEVSPFFDTPGRKERSKVTKRIKLARNDSAGAGDIALRKQRLLGLGDWTGVTLQKPIDVQFSRVTAGPDVWSKTRRVNNRIGGRRHEAPRRDQQFSDRRDERYGRGLARVQAQDYTIRVGSLGKVFRKSSSLSERTSDKKCPRGPSSPHSGCTCLFVGFCAETNVPHSYQPHYSFGAQLVVAVTFTI